MSLRHPLLEVSADHGFGVRDEAEPFALRRPRQVHGAAVVDAAECTRGRAPEADAMVSRVPGVKVGVVTADCVPVLLASGDGSIVAAVHAGWRGLARGVLPAAVDALRRLACARMRWIAAIGPHIGPCCYEVDAPVLDALAPCFSLDRATAPSRAEHALLDLGALAREALLGAGIAPEDCGALQGVCTRCDAERFHSHRRDGLRAGRLVHFIEARGPLKAVEA